MRIVNGRIKAVINSASMVCLLLFTALSGRTDVKIYRDAYGTPTLSSNRLADAIYGLGYVMAKDGGEAMATNYKQARGRLAEVQGKSQLLTDGFIRALGMEEAAEKAAGQLTGENALLVKSFCDGANQGLQEQKSALPAWVQPITPIDVLALAQLINCAFALEDLASQMLPGIGSNQFAVAPSRSASGHAILSADPHLTWSGPLLWYEFSIISRDIKFHGVTLNGLPIGSLGHTDHVAWSMTNNNPSLWALYKVVTSSSHPGQYNYHGEWRNFETVKLELKYREGELLKSEVQTWKRTAWGPMVPFRSQAAHLSTVGVFNQITEMLNMARAKNANEFREALKARGLSMWNIVYADTAGVIGYQYNARVPARSAEFDWNKPVDGSIPATKWGDLFNLDDLPHVQNPASGLLVNANSSPSLTPLGDELKGKAWPGYVTSYASTTRYERLAEELRSDHRVSVPNAFRYATDTLVPNAKRAIAQLPRKGSYEPSYFDALNILRGWNGRADIDSRGCALYMHWLLSDKSMGSLAYSAGQSNTWSATEIALAVSALTKASATVKSLYGRLDPAWGEVHVFSRANKTAPVSGLGYFLNHDATATVTPNFGPLIGGKVQCVGGSSFRMIVDLDPHGVRSWSALPFGDAQNPVNPHFADQMEMFGRGDYKDTLFGIKRLQAAGIIPLTLKTGAALKPQH